MRRTDDGDPFNAGWNAALDAAGSEMQRLRCAYLAHLQMENACKRTGRPCHEKCGCGEELEAMIAQAPFTVEQSKDPTP